MTIYVLILERVCEVASTYSPDLSPIEEAFSKLKSARLRAGARTREAKRPLLRRYSPSPLRMRKDGSSITATFSLTEGRA